MTKYAAQLYAHLTSYKEKCLGVSETGTFRYRGKDIPYGHILPRQEKWMNILEPVRDDIRTYLHERPKITLHQFFHHLNSSQAFALNLFFPYFQFDEAPILLRAMGLDPSFSGWELEHVADPTEGTNVDVAWWHAEDGGPKNWTYCEVKLSEQDFGSAVDDERHRKKLETIYRPVLESQVDPELLTRKRFFSRYQILRNIWLAARDDQSRIVFLMPRGNTSLWKPLQTVMDGLSPELRDRVHLVQTERVLKRLAENGQISFELAGYAELLAQKYLLSSPLTG